MLRDRDSRWRRPILGVILLATVYYGTRHITDEASVMLAGDMSRYIMNGVFMRDALAHGGLHSYTDLVSYAERYFAKYPALSLGHHPPLPSAALLPFFAVFGVSLFAARLAAICWFIAAVLGLYAVTRRLSNWAAASWASALFITNVHVIRAGQYVLSEMPMTALVLWSMHALLRWCDTRRARDLTWFIALAATSVYAKQLAVFMLPVYIVTLVAICGWRVFLDRQLLWAAGAGAALAAPMIVISVLYAPTNIALVLNNSSGLLHGSRATGVADVLRTIIETHVTVPTMLVTLASLILLMWRRNRQVIIGLTWLVCVVGGSVVFAGSVEPARYAFGALPAYFLMIAALAEAGSTPSARRATTIILTLLLAWKVWNVRYVYPSGAGGYEAAAEYVLASGGASSPGILFDGPEDTGYFVFFVRKHDPSGPHFVVRGDKILPRRKEATTPTADTVYEALSHYGIRFVVIEDIASPDPMARVIRQQVRTDRFTLRRRIPIVSTSAPGAHLEIYEYRDAGPPDPEAPISISLPRGNRRIALRVGDLMQPVVK